MIWLSLLFAILAVGMVARWGIHECEVGAAFWLCCVAFDVHRGSIIDAHVDVLHARTDLREAEVLAIVAAPVNLVLLVARWAFRRKR